jgi:eukaryotic-like serine/threonine-protein kinase
VHNRAVAVPLSNSLIGVLLSDRFRVAEKTGEEVLGSLYLANDEHPDAQGRKVVVKVLHPHLTGNQEKFKRFAREITATDMVKHPNTVGVIGWGQHLELHFLVLEHYLCHPLSDEVAKGPMNPERAAHIAAQVAAAVGAAHQEGVVHRNLSLHNVLLLDNAAQGDFVKVRDFGLSKLEQVDTDDTGTNLTQAGARVGNTNYMPPEYIEEGTVHPKGDLYAVGGLFFHMVTGQPPYKGRGADVLTAHVADPVPAPRRLRPELPVWCDTFVEALMAKAPKERPGGYQAVAMLEKAVGHSLAAPALLEVRADGTIVRKSRAPLMRPR